MKDYPLPSAWTPVVRQARERIARMRALRAAIQQGDRGKFLSLFDARIVRLYRDRFEPYAEQLCEWTRTEVLPAEKLGLRAAVGRAGLVCVDRRARKYRVRWTWPQQRFTDECVLAVCTDEPGPDADPRQWPALFRMPVDRPSWESGGGSRVMHVERAWMGHLVVVWAVVDLGLRMLFSRPLVVGRLGEAPKREPRRSDWFGPGGDGAPLAQGTAEEPPESLEANFQEDDRG
jgi:hypothetical protein